MLLTAVPPVFLTVQLVVAGVGAVLGVTLLHGDSDSAAGVGAAGFTVKLMATCAAVPVLGVAVSVPL